MNTLAQVSNRLMAAYFKLPSIIIRPENAFRWAAGWDAPIYNDNRLILSDPVLRNVVIDGLEEIALHESLPAEVIAGIATAGIPHGYGLAERMQLPFVYIRDKPKDHGMENRIEGIPADQDLKGKTTIIIEDLVSTGFSSASGIQAVRNANGTAPLLISIFSYDFPQAKAAFNGDIPFDKEGGQLEYACKHKSIIKYSELIEYGIKHRFVEKKHQDLLMEWSADPEGWNNRYKAEHGE